MDTIDLILRLIPIAMVIYMVIDLIISRKKYCPSCKTKLPSLYNPFKKGYIFNAYKCPNCKAIINFKGEIITDLNTHNKSMWKIRKWLYISGGLMIFIYLSFIIFVFLF